MGHFLLFPTILCRLATIQIVLAGPSIPYTYQTFSDTNCGRTKLAHGTFNCGMFNTPRVRISVCQWLIHWDYYQFRVRLRIFIVQFRGRNLQSVWRFPDASQFDLHESATKCYTPLCPPTTSPTQAPTALPTRPTTRVRRSHHQRYRRFQALNVQDPRRSHRPRISFTKSPRLIRKRFRWRCTLRDRGCDQRPNIRD